MSDAAVTVLLAVTAPETGAAAHPLTEMFSC